MSTATVTPNPTDNVLPDFDQKSLKAAFAKRKPAAEPPSSRKSIEWPGFLKQANQEYTSGNAHVFVLHGNVNDYPDNEGHGLSLRKLMAMAYDDNYVKEIENKEGFEVGRLAHERGAQKQDGQKREVPTRICAVYVINKGLRFDSDDSKKLFQDILTEEYGDLIRKMPPVLPPDFLEPRSFESTRNTLEYWFEATKKRLDFNRRARVSKTSTKQEALMTVVFFDCDIFLPSGNISSLNADRTSIGFFRNWAKDKDIGTRNKVFLVTQHLSQLHESLRGASSQISGIAVPKPSFEDRESFSKNFCSNLGRKCQILKQRGESLTINGKEVAGIEFAEGFDHHQLAIQASGMSRNQIERAFNDSLNRGISLDDHEIRIVKQKCMEEEYDGILEFVHPTHGFREVGGHDEIKQYFMEKIVEPLRIHDARTCSTGVLLTGPGGTGKTFLAKAAAFEARANFVEMKLGKLLNKYVGGTEERTQKMLDGIWASAPCVVLIDEIEAALGSRVSQGDSGVSNRMFSSMLTFLSDESRLGKIVVVACTNRPDLLDPVVIRSGRLGDVLPVLPPPQTGEESFLGRANILKALALKHKVTFEQALQQTMQDSQKGLGRLLMDESQIWTGAEIEAVLKDAIGLAIRAKRDKAVLTADDWNLAMDSIIPSTGQLEDMTELALLASNNVRYAPEIWRERLKAKSSLIASLKSKGYRVG